MLTQHCGNNYDIGIIITIIFTQKLEKKTFLVFPESGLVESGQTRPVATLALILAINVKYIKRT